MHRRLATILCLLAVSTATPRGAAAHGIWGHIHVTGWAIENLPPGELRDFFADPEVMNAALFGAAFTDSGYFPQSGELAARSRAYSEHTHWEPFVQDFIAWIIENDPPPWDDLESRRRAAFLMGAASHGLQDEIFDSLFLHQVTEKDGAGQGEADPGSDGFLALDAHLRFAPEMYVPMQTLLELYTVLDAGVDASTIRRSVEAMTFLYVSEAGWITAEGLGNTYSEQIPWTRAHYMDPNIPGSLRAEILPTGRYLQAVWDRLHDRFDPADFGVSAYPDLPRRLLSPESDSPDSLVTFIFGAGVRLDGLASRWDGDDGEVAHRLVGTRWGNAYPRLVSLNPSADLTPGAWYTAAVMGAEIIDGRTTDAELELRFQVECAAETECEPVEIDPPAIDGPEEVGQADAGEDAGAELDADLVADAVDSGADTAVESGTDSATRVDAEPEADGPDSASADAATSSDRSKSGCATARSSTPLAGPVGLGALGLGLFFGRRRLDKVAARDAI